MRTLAGIVTRLRTERSGVRVLVGARVFSLLQNVSTGTCVRPASYSVSTAGKVAGPSGWPLTSIQCRD